MNESQSRVCRGSDRYRGLWRSFGVRGARQRLAGILLLAVALGAVPAMANRFSWGQYRDKPDEWYRNEEAGTIAANVLSHQSEQGSWPKNIDTSAQPYTGRRSAIRGTFDNNATFGEMRFLARAARATGDRRYRAAFVKALDHILEAQYPTGGWPQYYPPGSGYARHITLNDGVMIHILELLREIDRAEHYDFLSEDRREAARAAFAHGVQCLLDAQICVDGRRTAWCQQHDAETLEPRGARSYEHPSITGGESAGVLLFLMSLEAPTPEIVEAIEAGVGWYRDSQLYGIRVVRLEDGDRVIVEDPDALPLWARFYEIDTNRPIFSGRDGVIKYRLDEIEYERRRGYAWYGGWGRRVLDRYEQWKKEQAVCTTMVLDE